MAVPCGSIRPFVESGRPMIDLLQRLAEKNGAVDYVTTLLAAFRDVEAEPKPEESNQGHTPDSSIYQSSNALQIPTSLRGVGPYDPSRPVAAFPIPPSETPRPQPLAEPLTNRELDVLELLAQRL